MQLQAVEIINMENSGGNRCVKRWSALAKMRHDPRERALNAISSAEGFGICEHPGSNAAFDRTFQNRHVNPCHRHVVTHHGGIVHVRWRTLGVETSREGCT